MVKTTDQVIGKLKLQWVRTYLVEKFVLSISISLLIWSLFIILFPAFANPVLIIVFILVMIISIPGRRLRRISERNILRLLNRQSYVMEESAELMLVDDGKLPPLTRLQKQRVNARFASQPLKLNFPSKTKRNFILLSISSLFFLGVNIIPTWNSPPNETSSVLPKSLSSGFAEEESLAIESLQVEISPPPYTSMDKRNQNGGDLKVVEGSGIRWQVMFNREPSHVMINIGGTNSMILEKYDEGYTASMLVNEHTVYDISFRNAQGETSHSEYYKIEVLRDNPPIIEVDGIDRYEEFEFGQQSDIDLRVKLDDDYGLTDAKIIATISKGSGEGVKFREQQLAFDNSLNKGQSHAILRKKIEFDYLEMTPGDELYFYVEAVDNKYPKKNLIRSDTYFIALRDTVSYTFSLEGNLGVDLMPEYFRSQRQIIIDTEKLISEKGQIEKEVFNSKSNKLGFDQKALRLKYGQFLGIEDESGIAIVDSEEIEETVSEGDGEETDPLYEYTHDHDNQDVELDDTGEPVVDPLEPFTHAHDAEEIATFFDNTIKGKLRGALALMWDAELYLRLYEPNNSLPYQYQALRLIKEIKNHARIYVHRIGFDPPPIKEETRLTGDLEEVKTRQMNSSPGKEVELPWIRMAIQVMEQQTPVVQISEGDRLIFYEAGNELSIQAIANPGKYLRSLQYLKQLSSGESLSPANLQHLLLEMYLVIPRASQQPSRGTTRETELQELFYKALEE